MADYEAKLAACQDPKTKNILQTIFSFGNGLLYRKHVMDYMAYFFQMHPAETGRYLKILEDLDLIERISVSHVKICKLKKFALAFLNNKKGNQISSLKLTNYKIRKTAFVNEIAFDIIRMAEKNNENLSFNQFFNFVRKGSTLWLPQFQSGYIFLETLDLRKQLSSAGREEKQKLQDTAEKKDLALRLKESKKEKRRTNFEGFNFNSLYGSNAFVKCIRNLKGKRVMVIAILDLTGQFSKKKALGTESAPGLVEEILRYLYRLTEKIEVQIEFYFENAERLEVCRFSYDDLAVNFHDQTLKFKFDRSDLKFFDLNLTNTLFGHQRVMLAGNHKKNKN
ncbi:hypothetical protein ACOTVE_09090 [Campylobacter jejuni]|uniref:hypothetical protein n=1 Tax=Campylobacter jejuni TaxID=197 RepID=UPI003BA38BBF